MKTLIILFILIFLTFTPALVKAQETGVTISPIQAELNLKPEEVYEGVFTITNNENSDFNLSFSERIIKDGALSSEELNWFTIINPVNVLPANKSVNISYSLKVPNEVNNGLNTRYILAELSGLEENVTAINLVLPFRVDVKVNSLFESQADFRITNFEVDNRISIDATTKFNIQVENINKSSPIKLIGNFSLINPSGQIVYSQVLNESLKSISDLQDFSIEFDITNTGLNSIGQYTAQVLFTESISGKSQIEKITFVYVDKTYLIAVVVILIFLLFILKLFKDLKKINLANKDELNQGNIGAKREIKKKSLK